MRRVSERTGTLLRALCMATFGTICVLMMVGVANRFFPLGSFGWSDEIVELMQVWTVFIGAAELWRCGLHFRVDIVPQQLAGTLTGKALDILLLACSLVFLIVFTWQAFTLTRNAINVSPIFALSRRLWYAPMPLSGALMIVFTLSSLAAAIRAPARRKETHEPAKYL